MAFLGFSRHDAHLPCFRFVSPNRVRGASYSAAVSQAARAKRVRATGAFATFAHVPNLHTRLLTRVDVTIVRIAPRLLDDDNYVASCKALRDGIADAFKMRDNDPRITFWYEQRRGKPKEYAARIEYRVG